jgi:hypothetical protein
MRASSQVSQCVAWGTQKTPGLWKRDRTHTHTMVVFIVSKINTANSLQPREASERPSRAELLVRLQKGTRIELHTHAGVYKPKSPSKPTAPQMSRIRINDIAIGGGCG